MVEPVENPASNDCTYVFEHETETEVDRNRNVTGAHEEKVQEALRIISRQF